jgi:ABC-type transporter Mla subunit MlaD
VVSELLIIGGGAAFGGFVVGALLTAFFSKRRTRARVQELGGEIARMHKVAKDKMAGDDPDLKTLLRNLNTAVEQTYRAVDALEDTAQLTKRKSEGGRQILASSRQIVSMIEELGGDMPEIDMSSIDADPEIELANDKQIPPLK